MTALIEANPDSDAGAAGWPIDGNRLALWTIKIAMIFLAIGVVNFFWKRWCRRRVSRRDRRATKRQAVTGRR